jgi:hypothetical protein
MIQCIDQMMIAQPKLVKYFEKIQWIHTRYIYYQATIHTEKQEQIKLRIVAKMLSMGEQIKL